MKFLLSIALTSLILFGCGEKNSEEKNAAEENIYNIDTTGIVTTPLENSDQNFLMRYKLELNKEYKYRIATITDNKQTIKLDTTISQEANQKVFYIINIKPTEIDPDSIFEIKCNISSIKIDATANGENHSYQSGTKDSLEMLKFGNYESLVNRPFNLRVDNMGNILEIYKTDGIISKFLEIQNLADSVTTDERNILREQILESALKPLLSEIFKKLPEKTMAKNSAWKISQPSSPFLVFQLQNNNIFIINSLEEYNDDKVAVISEKLEAIITGDTKIFQQGINYEFEKPVSEASGTIYFNIDNGHLLKSKITTKISVSYTMEGDTPAGKQKGSRSDVMEYTNIVELL